MRKKPPLTKKRSKWIENRNVALHGTRLAYNAALQSRYERSLKNLTKQMTLLVKKKLIDLFEGRIAEEYFEQQEMAAAMDASIASKAKQLLAKLLAKFDQLFSFSASVLSTRMIEETKKSSEKSLHVSLKQLSGGLSLKTSVVPEGMEDVSRALIAENVSLIKSIPQQYFKDITGSVMRSITTGNGLADLVPDLRKYSGQSERRVKNLALDQTRKAYNSINKERMQSVNVKQFEWVHSGGGQKPRASHMKISGTIFSFENLEKEQAALGVPEADQGIPGYPINCRCTMIPVIKFED